MTLPTNFTNPMFQVDNHPDAHNDANARINDLDARVPVLELAKMPILNTAEYDGDLDAALAVALAEERAIFVPPSGATWEGTTALAWDAAVPILGLAGSSFISFPNLTNLERGLTIYGTQGTAITIDANVGGGATTVTLTSTAGLAAGGWLLLKDPDTLIVPEGDADDIRKTEFVQIKSVDSATVVTLTAPTRHSYTTANNSVAYPTTMAERPYVEGVRLVGPSDPEIAVIGIEFRDCLSPFVRDVEGYAINNRLVNFSRCVDAGGENISDEGTVGVDDGNGSQYTLGIVNSCQNAIFKTVRSKHKRHAVATGGDSCNTVIVHDVIAEGMWNSGVDCHPGQCDVRYKTIRVHGTEGPEDSSSADGITMQSSWFTIEDVYMTDLWRHGLTIQPQDTFDTRGTVDNVVIERPGRHAAATGRAVLVSTQQSTIDTEYLNMDRISMFNFPGAGFEVNPNGVENEGPLKLRRLRVHKLYGESPTEGAHVMRLNYCKSPTISEFYGDASRARRGFRADFCEDVRLLFSENINDDSSSSDIAIDLRSVAGARIVNPIVRPGGEGASTGVDTGIKLDNSCTDVEVIHPHFEVVEKEIIWGTGTGHTLSLPSADIFRDLPADPTADEIKTALELDSEAWHIVGEAGEPAFENSWVNSATATDADKVAFYKDPLGRVHLRRGAKDGTVSSSATGAIFTLPAGYRPATTRIFAVTSADAFGSCRITSEGRVRAAFGSSTNFFLDGISFKAEG